MSVYLESAYSSAKTYFNQLPNDWKEGILDTYAITFVGTYMTGDLDSAMTYGAAFGTAKAVSTIAGPYLNIKESISGRLANSFLRGFTLRAIINRDLKRACFGGVVYSIAEIGAIGIEKVLFGATTLSKKDSSKFATIAKAGTSKFASKSASKYSMEAGKQSILYGIFTKAVVENVKDLLSGYSKFILEAIDSVLSDSVFTWMTTRDFKEGLVAGRFALISFLAEETYIKAKEIFTKGIPCDDRFHF